MTDWNKNYKSASMIGRNPEIVRDAANAEIERLKAALMWIWDQGDGDVSRVVAREALEGKDD